MHGFKVVGSAHYGCEECAYEAEHAVIMARATGSTGSTHRDNSGHYADVVRILS